MPVHHNVLVIDSMSSALDDAGQLARDLGHQVFPIPSPVGAGTALVEHEIDVVLLGWDLAESQDQKLITLVDSWRRLRRVQVVIVVRARAEELVELVGERSATWVIEASTLDTELPSLLGQSVKDAVAIASLRPEGSPFVARLAERIRDAAEAWEAVAQGAQNPREVELLLGVAQSQAGTLMFSRLSNLILESLRVVHHCESRGQISPDQYNAVSAALRFAAQITEGPPYDADCDVSALVRRLRESRGRRTDDST